MENITTPKAFALLVCAIIALAIVVNCYKPPVDVMVRSAAARVESFNSHVQQVNDLLEKSSVEVSFLYDDLCEAHYIADVETICIPKGSSSLEPIAEAIYDISSNNIVRAMRVSWYENNRHWSAVDQDLDGKFDYYSSTLGGEQPIAWLSAPCTIPSNGTEVKSTASGRLFLTCPKGSRITSSK